MDIVSLFLHYLCCASSESGDKQNNGTTASLEKPTSDGAIR
ncbi:unnamed protein product [Amoebophrya sp. A25]|nr:unnamed protein product [Amoebophrya sp. A25]|eukprot:GSA25T00017190001.1